MFGLNGPGTVAYLLIMTCRIAFKHHNHRAPDMSRLCHNRLFVDLSPVSVPMLLLVNINQREENLVKLSPWSPSPLIASQQTGSPWECWVTVHSPTVNRHCPLIRGSQMFQAVAPVDYFLLDHISPPGAQSVTASFELQRIIDESDCCLLSEITA